MSSDRRSRALTRLVGPVLLSILVSVCPAMTQAGDVAVVVNRSARSLDLVHPSAGVVGSVDVAAYGSLSDVAVSADGSRLYATTREGLLVVDTESLQVVTTISASRPLPGYRLALSPDGKAAAISHSNGQVSFFDLVGGELIGRSPPWQTSFEGIEGIAYSRDGRFLYATASAPSSDGFLNETGFVIIIDTTSLRIAGFIEIGRAAHHIVVTADGLTGYVAGGFSVTRIDLARLEVDGFVFIDSPASDLALSVDESVVYVTGFYRLEPIPPALVAVDAASLAVTDRIQLAGCGNARRVVVTRDGAYAFIVAEDLSGLLTVDLERFEAGRFSRTIGEPLGVVSLPQPGSVVDPIGAASDDEADPWACEVSVEIGSGVVTADGEVTIHITLHGGPPIAAMSQDILFASTSLRLAPNGACRANPEIGVGDESCFGDDPIRPCKSVYYNATGCPGNLCPDGPAGHTMLRALVFSGAALNAYQIPIPPGVVYRCRFTVAEGTDLGGPVPLVCADAHASDKNAHPVAVACRDGVIRPADGASGGESRCPGDCNRDRQVTVDELITLSRIALGSVAVSQCSAGDADLSGQITIDEITVATRSSLDGCPVPLGVEPAGGP